MKRTWVSITSAFILLIGIGGLGYAAPSSSKKTYTLNMGTMFYDPAARPDMNATGRSGQKFADLVKEKSKGRVTVNIHWASVLGGTADLFDMLRKNDLDMAYSGTVSQSDKRFAVTSVASMITSFDMAKDLMASKDGELFKLTQKIINENNVQMLANTVGQFRGFFNNKKEIHLPSDVKGLMIRMYADEGVTNYWNKLCSTTVMPISEVYTGLQLKTIDGLEFWPTALISNGYGEVVKYYSDINWQWQPNASFLMSKKLYDSMDNETKALLEECAWEAANYYWELESQYIKDAYAYLKDKFGVKIYELTPAEHKAWEDYGKSLYPKYREIVGAATFDSFMAVVDKYKASNK